MTARYRFSVEHFIMKSLIAASVVLLPLLSLAGQSGGEATVKLSDHVSLIPGPVNGACIEKDNARLVIYGDPTGKIEQAEKVLFTHSRRDVVWAGRGLVEKGAEAVVPDADADRFTKVEQFWSDFRTRRFHDYAQQGTRILTTSMKVARTVKPGEDFSWRGIPIKVLDTPGYSRNAVSYLIDIDGLKYAFVGDIIYGDGKLFDLYSLQDAIAEAKIGGYHGWAGRMGPLIQSLQRVAAEKPDVLVPVRGPVIRKPVEAINVLIERLQKLYENYLSISAGRWYFKSNYDILARRVLGDEPKIDWMPWAEVINQRPPEWIVPISNSRLIISGDRSGFLIDCGGRRIIDEIIKLRDAGKVTGVEGLFITHYHDDHTDSVGAALAEFKCPVYATGPSVDILEHPGAYRLPCLTPNPISDIKVVPEAHKMRWKEFTFTFHDFPGQTIYHDSLLVEKDGGEKIFFIGDSFTPSGIDDYCLQNRNLMHESMGYSYCLGLLRKIPAGTLLINQHVVETFSFSAAQLDRITETLAKRKALLAELFPWDEPNFGIDEQWVRFYPYGSKVKPGQTVWGSLRLFNHSNVAHTFTVRLNLPPGLNSSPGAASLTIPARTEQQVDFQLIAGASVVPGTYVLTADVQWEGWSLPFWTEAIVEIE